MEFADLKQSFKEFFRDEISYVCAGNESKLFRCEDNAGWIFAVCNPNEPDETLRNGIHYELVRRGSGSGSEYYIELHFELYRNQCANTRKELERVFSTPKNRRTYLAYSYYSSSYWRTRTPISEAGDVKEDLKKMVAVVGSIVSVGNMVPVNNAGDVVIKDVDRELTLPCQIPLQGIANMLSIGAEVKEGKEDTYRQNALVLPPVQRGKVWNAARIETLWDSIMQDFPIGAFSVKKHKNGFILDLLDGQQRSIAISLGYDTFARNKNSSVLWIDVAPKQESKKYAFYVTTPSQPWGYAETSNETRNELLRVQDRRKALEKLEACWHDENEKPYSYELFPIKAQCPVPVSLLRTYVEEAREYSFENFEKFCDSKLLPDKFSRNWLINARRSKDLVQCDYFSEVCKRLKDRATYSVFFLDASGVAESDIALYFTRIGKGGVVPTDEELAYSVLKTKLVDVGFNFKTIIDKIVDECGMAWHSRIAHIAIRCFKSIKDSEVKMFGGSVLSAAIELGKDGKAPEKAEFKKFMETTFPELIEEVNACVFDIKKDEGLTAWHRCRYCQEFNGDIYLFLLLATHECNKDAFKDFHLGAIAEVIYGYASQPDYAIRRILSEGPVLGLGSLLLENYYRTPRMVRPIAPDVLRKFEDCRSLAELEKLQSDLSNASVISFIREGYNNSRKNRAYNILLFSCKHFKENKNFSYDKALGIWAEDNCPWDYDHIMPHSWIDKMLKSAPHKNVCDWLVNSIGNLAPLPFSLNRSLSDDVRCGSYPYTNPENIKEVDECQKELWITDGDAIAGMWDKDKRLLPEKFCLQTVSRFCLVYRCWYENLGVGKLFDYSDYLEKSDMKLPFKMRWMAFCEVEKILKEKEIDGFSIRYVDGNYEKSAGAESGDKSFDVCLREWLTLSKDFDNLGVSVALTKSRSESSKWEIGLRKGCMQEQTNPDFNVNFTDDFHRQGFEMRDVDSCNGNSWWYLCRTFDDVDIQRAVEQLIALDNYCCSLARNVSS